MKKNCDHCKQFIEDIIYIDFEMTGKNLCQGCSILSDIKSCYESIRHEKSHLERYREDFETLLGKESEEYSALIKVPIRAIKYYHERIQELKWKLSQNCEIK